MKKIHRRGHLLIWGFMMPVVLLAGIIFWQMRPAIPVNQAVPELITDRAETN